MILFLILSLLFSPPSSDPVEKQFLMAIYKCLKGSDEVEDEIVYLDLERLDERFEIAETVRSAEEVMSKIVIRDAIKCLNTKPLDLQADE